MITLEQCRKIVPEFKDLSDEQLLKIRDSLYAMVNLALDDWVAEKLKK